MSFSWNNVAGNCQGFFLPLAVGPTNVGAHGDCGFKLTGTTFGIERYLNFSRFAWSQGAWRKIGGGTVAGSADRYQRKRRGAGVGVGEGACHRAFALADIAEIMIGFIEAYGRLAGSCTKRRQAQQQQVN